MSLIVVYLDFCMRELINMAAQFQSLGMSKLDIFSIFIFHIFTLIETNEFLNLVCCLWVIFYFKECMMELREQFSVSEFDFYYFMLYISLFVLFSHPSRCHHLIGTRVIILLIPLSPSYWSTYGHHTCPHVTILLVHMSHSHWSTCCHLIGPHVVILLVHVSPRTWQISTTSPATSTSMSFATS